MHEQAHNPWWGVMAVFGGLLLLVTGLALLPDLLALARGSNAPAAALSSEQSMRQHHTAPPGFMRAPSGQLLPRFVSLAQPGVRMRSGPGPSYPAMHRLALPHQPLEVVAEAGAFWRVRDAAGREGWLPANALSTQRTAVVAPWNHGRGRFALRAAPAEDAPLRAWLQGGVILHLRRCDGHWCEATVSGFTGWVRQDLLWGVYARERIDAAPLPAAER